MVGLEALLAQTQPSGLALWIDRVARAPLSMVVAFAVVCTLVRVALAPYLLGTPTHLRTGFYPIAKFLNETADALVYAGVVVFMLVRPFAVQTFFIPSGSMIDTLLINDYIVANKWVYRVSEPKRGDIVVFKPPKRALFPGQGDSDFIKRLIGLPGDVVEWKDRQMYINGQKLDEPYVEYSSLPTFTEVLPKEQWSEVAQADFKLIEHNGKVIPVQYDGEFANTGSGHMAVASDYVAKSLEEMREFIQAPPAKIPEGMYLFIGDNRNGSFDGRGWGLVPRADIIGKSEFIWMPIHRWGVTR